MNPESIYDPYTTQPGEPLGTTPMVGEPGGGSTFGLVRDLLRETEALARTEIELAATEAKENLNAAQRAAGVMASGGAVLHAGLLTLAACAVFALDLIWPTWQAALVVGLVLAGIGGAMMASAKSKMRPRALVPDHTMQTIRDTRQFMRRERDRAMEKWQ